MATTTTAAFIEGNTWIRLTESDGPGHSRALISLGSPLVYQPIPAAISAERRAELHAKAVRLAGPAPTSAELRKFGAGIAALKRIHGAFAQKGA